MTRATTATINDGRTDLVELARLFLKLGIISFGGPAAHIALMREEVVRRRQWITEQQFLDLLGATSLIPGPNSTEMAIHIGHVRAGWRGLLVAGVCFISPAVVIVLALAAVYVRFSQTPEVRGLLLGITPVVVAIVLHAIWALGRVAVKSTWLAIVGLACAIVAFAGVTEVAVLVAGGVAGALRHMIEVRLSRPDAADSSPLVVPPLLDVLAPAASVALASSAVPYVSLGTLFGVFFKAGALLFGSGYVLIAFLRADLVERLGWLTEQELLNAIAIGQTTPGPVFSTATFVGFVLGGTSGALIATVAIFLPAFVYVAVSAPLIPRLRRSPLSGQVLDGVNVAALALMVFVAWQIAARTLVDPLSLGLAAAATLVLLSTRINSTWLIAAGAVIGIVRSV